MASIPLNGSTSVTFNIANPNSGLALTGVAFSDTLPAGLVVANPNGANNMCNGTVSAVAGSSTISLSGGTLGSMGSCSITVNVTGTTAGTKSNTTGAISSNETGAGATSNTATLAVEGPPSIAKAFGSSTVALNGTTSLTFTITNPAANPVALTGVGFTDTLPTGLTVANSSATVCGGTLTTTSPTGIALSGAGINTNSQCQFSVTVTGAVAGSYTNTSGNVTSSNGGRGNTASAGLTVVAPPSISKAFGAANVPVNGTTSLTLTITNPNTGTALNGVAVSDTFPLGLQVAATPNATNTCGGTFTAAASSTSISLSGGIISANSSCAVSVNVTPTTSGTKNNTTGNVSSTNGGTGATSNTATFSAGDFTIAVSPLSQTIPPGHMAVYTLTLASTTGFQGTINLSCTGGPPGSTCTITPSSVTLTSASETAKVTVDLAVPRGASKGTFTLTFTGTSGSLTHSTTATLKVGK